MRLFDVLTVGVATLALAACGKSADAPKSPEQVAKEAAAAGIARPQPGQYRVTTRVTNVSVPGMPADTAKQMQGMFSATGHSAEFCLTPQQAGMGYEEMTRRAAEGNCTYDRFTAADGKLDAAMTCQTGKGMTTKSEMSGTFSPTGSQMTMKSDATMPDMPGGGMHMEAEVVTQRIGDCA